MRPRTLELQGFASFREPTTIDLDDADLFVFAGPTGSGKSTIIDSMCFSLYGSVPRYDNRNLVAPVISQGLNESRVRLTFTLGERAYTATRVVRRTKTGASTKEARLERVDPAETSTVLETLAGSADEVSTAVADLLGLSFDHFVKTVVLPQGEFQEFLHATGKERQNLLVELLDLDIYREIATRARDRAKQADARIQVLQARLEGPLQHATEEALTGARERVAALEDLQEDIAEAAPQLEKLTERGGELGARAESARERAALVAGVEAPDGVEELTEQRSSAADRLEQAREEVATATERREEAEREREDLPGAGRVRALTEALEEQSELEDAIDEAETRVEETRAAHRKAEEAHEEAVAATRTAREVVRTAERADLTAVLAADLEAGEACPVCERPLEEVPDHDPSDDLAAARSSLETAEAAEEQARERLQAAAVADERAATELGNLQERRAMLSDRIDTLAEELAEATGEDAHDLGEPDALAALAAQITAASESYTAARDAEQRARQQVAAAEETLGTIEKRHRDAWRAFDEARDEVAALDPPAADREDLAGSWRALCDWAAETKPELEETAAQAEAAVAETRTEYRALREELREQCREHDVEVGEDQSAGEACAAALASARDRTDRIREQIEEATRLRKQIGELETEQRVAHDLGTHLRSSNFEGWLLTRALRRLVIGATEILRDLTGGAYSLTLDDSNDFAVVDHRNADEARPARTLSGGETFLASLSLALALSEHVADLAAEGSARLDALFLDEGFGTLDADTLDTVAAAIEELGARGRMVGIITHVRDLAERIPVRYEVRKTAAGSTVEKVVT